MTFPFTIHIGDFNIQLHTLTELLGMFIGFRYFLFLRKRKGDYIKSEKRIFIIIGAMFGAVIGSRFVGCLENVEELLQAQNLGQYIMSNKSIAGGLLGGLFGVEIMKYFIKEKNSSGDLFVFPLLLSMLIGRIGCFSMGIYETTFGKETTSVFGMNLGDGLLRHPVMLYELFFLTLLWITLHLIKYKFELKSGILFQYFLISYLLFRFFVEFLKPNIIYFVGIGTIQIVCLIGLIYYLILNIQKRKPLKNNQ